MGSARLPKITLTVLAIPGALSLLLASCSSFGGGDNRADGGGAVDGDPAATDALAEAGAVARRVYVAGGFEASAFGGSATYRVRSAPIGPDGDLGTWRDEAPLPEVRRRHAVVAVGRTLLVIGGAAGPGLEPTVFAATAGADGRLDKWETLPPIDPVSEAAAAADGRFVHLLGGERASAGFDAQVLWMDVTTRSVPAPTTALPVGLRRPAAVRVGDLLVSIGGAVSTTVPASSDVYSARVRGDGTLEAWAPGAALPAPLSAHAAVSVGDHAYVLGGVTQSPVDQVLRAAKEGNKLGAWQSVQALPSPRSALCAVTTGSHVYAIGGLAPVIGAASPYLDEVLVSTVLADGALGPWKPTTKLSPATHSMGCAAF